MNKIIKSLILLIIFLLNFCVNSVFAESYTLEELINISLKRNELLQAAKAKIESIQYETKSVTRSGNPSISAYSGSKRTVRENEFAYGTSGPVYLNGNNAAGPTGGIGVSFPVRFPGKRSLQQGIGEENLKKASLEMEATELFIQFDIIRLVYQIKATEEKLEHAKEEKSKLNLVRLSLRNRPLTAPRLRLDAEITKGKFLMVKKRIRELEGDLWTLNRHLEFYTGISELPSVEIAWFKEGVQFAQEEVMVRAMKENMQLKQRLLEQESIRKKIQLAQREKYPDFNLNANYSQEKSADLEKFVSFGLSFEIPVFNNGSDKTKSYEKQLQAEQARNNYETAMLRKEITSVLFEYNTQREIIKDFPFESFSKMHDSIDYAEMEFRKGRISVADFIGFLDHAHDTHTEILDTQIVFLKKYLSLLNLIADSGFMVK